MVLNSGVSSLTVAVCLSKTKLNSCRHLRLALGYWETDADLLPSSGRRHLSLSLSLFLSPPLLQTCVSLNFPVTPPRASSSQDFRWETLFYIWSSFFAISRNVEKGISRELYREPLCVVILHPCFPRNGQRSRDEADRGAMANGAKYSKR